MSVLLQIVEAQPCTLLHFKVMMESWHFFLITLGLRLEQLTGLGGQPCTAMLCMLQIQMS